MNIRSKAFDFIKNKKSFIVFTGLNFFDKGLTFVIPLVILSLFDNPELYNELEYIYSWATFLVIFCSLTLPNYLFYGYKISSDKDRYIDNYHDSFKFSNLIWGPVFIIVLLLSYNKWIDISFGLLSFIIIRLVYLNITTYLTAYYRLIDKISHIFYYTSLCNLAIIVTLLLLYYIGAISLLYIFMIQLAIVLFFLRNVTFDKLKQTFLLIKEAVVFGWPTVIYLLLFMGVNNFAKIYAFDNLREDEMTILSFVQRFAMIIQLGHASISAYFSKKLFMEKQFFNKKLFFYYLLALTIILILSYFGITFCLPFFIKIDYDNISLITLLLLLYIYVWCIAAYSDLHFNKIGKPIYVLLNSIPAVLFYVFWIFFVEKTLISLSTGMFIYALILVITCYSSLFYHKRKNESIN